MGFTLGAALIPVPSVIVRTYADDAVSIHDLGVSTGWAGIGFPVSAGDNVTLRFEVHNGTYDVRFRFGDDLGSGRNSIRPYDAANVTNGSFAFAAPRDGSVQIDWRAWWTGETVFSYVVHVVHTSSGPVLSLWFG